MITVTDLSERERARMRDEREHLLASLNDLDAERAAGDIDDDDYAALRDDYTARAAQLSRALEGAVVRRRVQRDGTSLRDRLAWGFVVVAVAIAAAWAMTVFSGARGSDATASGEIRESTQTLIARAAEAFGSGDADRAIELYGDALEIQPTNVEALTYRGWITYQTGDIEAARRDLDDAVAIDPTYGDVRVFRTVVALDDGEYSRAQDELRAFDASNPSPVALQLVNQRQLRERVAVAGVLEPLNREGLVDLTAEGISIDQAQLAGETLVDLGLVREALELFGAILTIEPNSAPAQAWQGWTIGRLAVDGDKSLFVDAEAWLDRAVTADPSYPDARVFRAFLYLELDRPEEARAELDAFDALDVQPADMLALIDAFDLRGALA